jgi:hypothetical protein
MIETDEQRRWWFATHPEFSSSRKGATGSHETVSEPQTREERLWRAYFSAKTDSERR